MEAGARKATLVFEKLKSKCAAYLPYLTKVGMYLCTFPVST